MYIKTQGLFKQLSIALGDCLTGSELDLFMARYNFKDDKILSTKWKRIHNAFIHQTNTYKDQQPIFNFIEEILQPVNYKDKSEKYDSDCENVSIVLRFIGYEINKYGKVVPAKIAETISEARKRAESLKEELTKRNAHPILFNYCKEEFLNNDYFHAVQEAIKSIMIRIRDISGLNTDGRPLIQQAFKKDDPYILINNYLSSSEKNEHEGFVLICEGLISMVRNPTSHEARIHWTVMEQDALEILGMVSFVHRRLEKAQKIKSQYS